MEALPIADLSADIQPPAQDQQQPAAEQPIAPAPAPNHLIAEQILADQPAIELPPIQPEQPPLIVDLAADIQLPAQIQQQPAAEQPIVQLIPIQPAEQSASDDEELAELEALLIADFPADIQPPAQDQQQPAAEQPIAPVPAPDHLLAE